MTVNAKEPWVRRARRVIAASLKRGTISALRTLRMLFVVMVPVILVMMSLEAAGLLPKIAWLFAPLMRLLGLPGNAALAFISGAFVNLYSALAVAANLGLTVKELTVLALLALVCHNLLVECAVQKQAGTGAWTMVAVRFVTGVAGAFAASLLIPDSPSWTAATIPKPAPDLTTLELLRTRAIDNGFFLLKIAAIVLALMIVMEFLRQTGALKALTWLMRPVTWLAGLPAHAGFTVMTATTLGLAYGAGTIIEESKRGELTEEEGFRTNVFIGTTHSLVEDTGLFAAQGASILVIVLGRLAVGCVAVRLASATRRLFGRRPPGRAAL